MFRTFATRSAHLGKPPLALLRQPHMVGQRRISVQKLPKKKDPPKSARKWHQNLDVLFYCIAKRYFVRNTDSKLTHKV